MQGHHTPGLHTDAEGRQKVWWAKKAEKMRAGRRNLPENRPSLTAIEIRLQMILL